MFRPAERRPAEAAGHLPFRPGLWSYHGMRSADGLLLDIGGVVLQPASVLVNRLAGEVPEVASAVAPWGGLGGSGDEDWHRVLVGDHRERDYWADRARRLLPVLTPESGPAETTSGEEGLDATRALMRRLYPRGGAKDVLRPEVIELMRDARRQGVPLGALTNDLEAFHGRAWVDQAFWVRWFDVVVDGSVTGILKPDPRAYAAGAAALNLPPERIVYLDDMPTNLAGGLDAGLVAVGVDHLDATPAVRRARALLAL